MKVAVVIITLILLVGVVITVSFLSPKNGEKPVQDLSISSRVLPGVVPETVPSVSTSGRLEERRTRVDLRDGGREVGTGGSSLPGGVAESDREERQAPAELSNGGSASPSIASRRSLPLLDVIVPFFSFLRRESQPSFYSEELGRIRDEMVREGVIREDEFKVLNTEAATVAFFEKFLEYEIIEKRGGSPEVLEENRRFLRESYGRLRRGNFFQK